MLRPHFCIQPTRKFSRIEAIPRDGAKRPLIRIYIEVPCAYTDAILRKTLRRRDWCVIVDRQEDADILWADYENLDWDLILAGKVRANSYFIRKGLSRKAQLSYYLKKFTSKNPKSMLCRAVPESLVIDTWEAFEDKMNFGALGGASFDISLMSGISQVQRIDWCLEDVRKRMEQEKDKLWIIKPSVTNKGAEIFVVQSFDQLREIVHQWTDIREWVVQQYIDRPLLFRRRKFHLRAYILAVGSLTVYFFNTVLLLSSFLPYDRNDISNELSHITNTVRQAEGQGFKEEDCVYLLSDLIETFERELGLEASEASRAVGSILQQMHSITGELFRAFQGEYTVFAPMPHCFELFGLDFLVDEAQNAWFLELNPGPDFQQTGSRLSAVIDSLFEETCKIVMDEDEAEDGTAAFSVVYRESIRPEGAGPAGGGMKLF